MADEYIKRSKFESYKKWKKRKKATIVENLVKELPYIISKYGTLCNYCGELIDCYENMRARAENAEDEIKLLKNLNKRLVKVLRNENIKLKEELLKFKPKCHFGNSEKCLGYQSWNDSIERCKRCPLCESTESEGE